MGEPEALHPFSSHFRSQLSDVLSRPAVAHRTKQIPDDKLYLETEIDSYSVVEFEKRIETNCTKRPATPPKPIHRTFTFDKTNPFSNNSGEADTSSLPKYAEVIKPKNRPKVPPKPETRSKVTITNTLPHTQKRPDEETKISKEDYFFRVNSLPNIASEVNNKNNRASGNFLQVDSQSASTPGYGQLNGTRHIADSNATVYHDARNDAAYCDVIPESPSYVDDYTSGTTKNDSCYENIYEDVNSKSTTSGELKLHVSSERHDGTDSDYTLMGSPASEINFKFHRKSLYENCAMINSQNSDELQPNEYENLDSPRGDPNKVGLPEQVERCQILAVSNDQVSPTSSFDDHDSSMCSVQSSMVSTTASSFQRVQVCFFPPSPPPDFYQGDGTAAEHSSGSPISGSSTRSGPSRSRIPVPIKPKSKDSAIHRASPPSDEPDRQLPPKPAPSPDVRSKSSSKKAKPIALSPPALPGNELTPDTGKALGSSGKGARWYEKLGCIHTDTIQPSVPYGRPGERKRSKSLNRDQRKSQFFLPVEPNASDPPNVQHT